jgi:dipeptidyl aminopeptidase/acylaminoacyl peptidase
MDAASPLLHADRIRAPLFVIQGSNDPRVPKSESDQIVAAVRARGGTAEYLLFESEGHGLDKLENRVRAYTAMAAFFERWLGAPPPHP